MVTIHNDGKTVEYVDEARLVEAILVEERAYTRNIAIKKKDVGTSFNFKGVYVTFRSDLRGIFVDWPNKNRSQFFSD